MNGRRGSGHRGEGVPVDLEDAMDPDLDPDPSMTHLAKRLEQSRHGKMKGRRGSEVKGVRSQGSGVRGSGGSGFWVQGSGGAGVRRCRDQGVQGSGFGGAGFRVQDSGFI